MNVNITLFQLKLIILTNCEILLFLNPNIDNNIDFDPLRER